MVFALMDVEAAKLNQIIQVGTFLIFAGTLLFYLGFAKTVGLGQSAYKEGFVFAATTTVGAYVVLQLQRNMQFYSVVYLIPGVIGIGAVALFRISCTNAKD